MNTDEEKCTVHITILSDKNYIGSISDKARTIFITWLMNNIIITLIILPLAVLIRVLMMMKNYDDNDSNHNHDYCYIHNELLSLSPSVQAPWILLNTEFHNYNEKKN